MVMVPTTHVSRSLVGMQERGCLGLNQLYIYVFQGGLTFSTSGNLPRMHAPGIPQGQPFLCTDVLSTVLPPFASRACDPVETRLISSCKRHAKYKNVFCDLSLVDTQGKKVRGHKTQISVRIVSYTPTYRHELLMQRFVRV